MIVLFAAADVDDGAAVAVAADAAVNVDENVVGVDVVSDSSS